MNLDSELQDKLDTPVKSFEVAFRSYVSTAIITAYPLEDSLKNEIVNRSNKLKESKAIFSGKFSSEIKSILGGRKVFGTILYLLKIVMISANMTKTTM